MPRDFYPRRDADVRAFTANLAERVAADWAALNLSEETATDYVAVQAAFADVYQKSQMPSERTPVVIEAKRAAARALESATRAIAHRVRRNSEIPLPTKITLGIHPPKSKYTRIARPKMPPVVVIAATGPRSVTIRLQDPERPWSRALPKGVAMAVLFVSVGELSPNDGGKPWRQGPVTSRGTATIRFTDEDLPPFAKVWITAYFANPRGERGPAATPAIANVPPGVMVAKRVRRAA